MRRLGGSWVIAALAFGGMLLVLLPTLGQAGLWSELETSVLDRTRAALGESVRNMTRSPWLPDALRTLTFSIWSDAWGLRLPHAVATASLVALASLLTRELTRSPALAVLAGVIAASMPQVALAGHTVLGNPFLEVFVACAWIAGHHASVAKTPRRRIIAGLVASLAVTGAVAAGGWILGAVLPMLLAATTRSHRGARRWGLVLATILSVGVAIVLIARQGEGYVPLLGASKDLQQLANPQQRRFAAVAEELSHALFPWIGFVLLGATQSSLRRVALWLTLGVVVGGAWTTFYGPTALPLTIPAAVCAASSVRVLVSPQRALERRWAVFFILTTLLLYRQDADLHPVEIALPHIELPFSYPAEALATTSRLRQLAAALAIATLVAVVFTWRRARLLGLVPFFVVAVGLAAVHHSVLLPATALQFSPKHALSRFATWREHGAIVGPLVVYRAEDPGLRIYGPQTVEVVRTVFDLQTLLGAAEPRAALLRQRDLAQVTQALRAQQRPIYVLDASHQSLRLVSNTLPAGAEDLNPIREVLFDTPPPIEHPTMVRFEDKVEIVGWQVDGPLVRGRSHTIEVVLRVLQRVPSTTEIYTRFLNGRLSRIHVDPQPIAPDVYPPAYWRPGDIIVHRKTFEVPPLEILPGTYDFIVGLRKNEHENFAIVAPSSEDPSAYGVRIRGKQNHFATLGKVEVW